ncbi:tyrosine recombinase XerC [Thioalkalivibrio sp.]|uniref:tyrosine recombinase XerC n=2 Tax=Thioalkalivibrio sp. TaxID=2093813 RepID=UPI003569F01B
MTPAAAPPGRTAGGSEQPRDAAVQAFLDHLRDERGLSVHTVSAYGRDLDRLRAGFTGGWEDLDPAVLRRIAAGLARAGRNPRSIQRFLSAARSFGRWAVREGLLESSPAAALRGPRPRRPLPRALDVDQASSAMLQPSERTLDRRDRAMLELLYSSGLRLSELTGLDLGHLDLAGGLVRVLGKGRRERTVPVGRMAGAALRDWLAVRPEWAGAAEPALFVSRRGRRLGNRAVQRRLALAGQRAGLGERLHPHRLRHAFASHLLESSGDLRAVQELLGHADLATTQIYTHLDFQHLAQVYDGAHPRARRKTQGNAGAQSGD